MIRIMDDVLYRLACLLLALAIILLPIISLSVVPSVHDFVSWFTYHNVMRVTGATWLSMLVTFLLHNILELFQK